MNEEQMKCVIERDQKKRKERVLALFEVALNAAGQKCRLTYIHESECVGVTFSNGVVKIANVAADSSTAMMYDILKQVFI